MSRKEFLHQACDANMPSGFIKKPNSTEEWIESSRSMWAYSQTDATIGCEGSSSHENTAYDISRSNTEWKMKKVKISRPNYFISDILLLECSLMPQIRDLIRAFMELKKSLVQYQKIKVTCKNIKMQFFVISRQDEFYYDALQFLLVSIRCFFSHDKPPHTYKIKSKLFLSLLTIGLT